MEHVEHISDTRERWMVSQGVAGVITDRIYFGSLRQHTISLKMI